MRMSSLFTLLALLAIVVSVLAAKAPKADRPLCGSSLRIDGSSGGMNFATATPPTGSDAVTVAVEGNIVVAAYSGTVSIYYYDPTTNTLSAKQNLTDDTSFELSFGSALSLNNGILIIGQPGWVDVSSPGAAIHGRVWAFQTLTDETSGFLDFFQLGDTIECTDTQDGLTGQSRYGAFVFQRNFSLVISSPLCCQGNRVGAAYTYHYNETTTTWETARPGPFGEFPIQAPAALGVGSQFGTSVAFDKSILIASLPGANDPRNSSVIDAGGMLNFPFDINTAKVCTSSDCSIVIPSWGQYPPSEDAHCGTSMSELNLDVSNRISIGCPGESNSTGQVLIGSIFTPAFSISNRIQSPTGTEGEGFGNTVAAQYDTVAVGTIAGTKVYLFERVPVPRTSDTYLNYQNFTADTTGRTQFGSSMDLDEALLVIGSWGGLDVYNCGKATTDAAAGLIPFIGLLILSAFMLL